MIRVVVVVEEIKTVGRYFIYVDKGKVSTPLPQFYHTCSHDLPPPQPIQT